MINPPHFHEVWHSSAMVRGGWPLLAPRAKVRPMSSYVQSVLQPGESVAFTSNIHWLIYLRPFVLAIVALAGLAWWLLVRHDPDQTKIPAYAMMLFGGFFALTGFLAAWF